MVSSALSSNQLSSLNQLLDRIAERQRSDFGNIVSDIKPDGTLITACDRWSDTELVQGLSAIAPGEGVLSEEGSQCVPQTEAYWVVSVGWHNELCNGYSRLGHFSGALC